MSYESRGEGWWQANDGKWYPPQEVPASHVEPVTTPPPVPPPVPVPEPEPEPEPEVLEAPAPVEPAPIEPQEVDHDAAAAAEAAAAAAAAIAAADAIDAAWPSVTSTPDDVGFAPLTDEAEPVAPPPVPPLPGDDDGEGAGSGTKGRRRTAVLVAIVVLLLLIGIGFFLTRGDDNKATIASAPASSSSSGASSATSESSSSSSSSGATVASSAPASSASGDTDPAALLTQVQSALLAPEDVGTGFQALTAPEELQTPCDSKVVDDQVKPFGVASADLEIPQEIAVIQYSKVYATSNDAQAAFDIYKTGHSCGKGTFANGGVDVTFGGPMTSGTFGVDDDFTIDARVTEAGVDPSGVNTNPSTDPSTDATSIDFDAVFVTIRKGQVVMYFEFLATQTADMTVAKSPEEVVKKALAKLAG